MKSPHMNQFAIFAMVALTGLAIFCAPAAYGAIAKLSDDEEEEIEAEPEESVPPKTGTAQSQSNTAKTTTSKSVGQSTEKAVVKKLDEDQDAPGETGTKTNASATAKTSTKTSTGTTTKTDTNAKASTTTKTDTKTNIKKLSGLLQDLPKFDDPVEAVKSRLDKVLVPYKLQSSEREPIDNEQLSENEILSWRLVYAKNFNKEDSDTEMLSDTEEEVDDGTGNLTIETVQPKQTFATITLIPSGALDLEKALLLRRELVPDDKILKEVIFVKYGITWSKYPCQYERLTYYLGTDDYFHYFASADISIIYTLFRALDMKDGADLNQLLIDNLSIEDENLFTKRFCIAKLGQFQDPVIPALVRAIKRIVAAEEYVIPHFLALLEMKTPKAFSIVCEAAVSKNDYLRKSAFSAILQLEQGIADLYPVYYEMIKSRDYITYGSMAFLQLGFADRLMPLIQNILDTPNSVQQFEEATRIKWLIQDRSIKTIHKAAYDDIVLSLIRSGEIKDSPQFIDMNESKASRELRLAEEDEERIADTKKKIINAKEVDLSIITAIELAFFYTADKRVSRDYINRVNNAGISLLKQLPRAEVTRILTLLTRYNTSEEEAAKLKDIRSKVGN